ncbi:delta-aminolevulinic acid dehydratase [Methanocella paludicola SANAE]|uniref:Delta-aminolevulinic acid dehydratase n=1 Tax=Methanocella paludicola (strain DSM 17711 / JCM 13418 / NBRC 101707 / SANAE) TaxID=304371 RepID=D1Z2S7_METPS|nr:porphobilinogen synthase [Methanocella paludicola]BAI62999.1 delta-aminolevulinic acid dehydratase [Methanocella paludicola SANAE]
MGYPVTRPRRLRRNALLRDLTAEATLSVKDLIYPIFIDETATKRAPIKSMPGVERLPLDEVEEEADSLEALGIPAVLLFGIPGLKDETGGCAHKGGNVIEAAVKRLKKKRRDLLVITDVCLCEYTTHGHCGPIKGGTVDNDATLDVIAKVAVNHARAGADIVAPSGMMDGMVHAIRSELDFNGLKDTAIMSYAAKYASAMYGPFREAADSGFTGFDRSSYQMDPRNSDEAMREVALDLDEGADIVMVKPALSYLDVVYRVKHEFRAPVAAYNVSGEYAMIKAAAANGWLDEKKAAMEALISMKRAGADMLITYFAKDIATLIK